ncbi:hypothetical protein VHEMI03200 [[Torrubiella] hemipterigena]|uniref:Peptidase S53 domain-containing protein n=1 Tax=[Torrubiella] hemipterigena TaxID=1531966 RepID=A0A0A1TCU3_9HYPO|nr:hypothetical protein VHEMI03200 [[Torrubiella] hemipterigena]
MRFKSSRNNEPTDYFADGEAALDFAMIYPIIYPQNAEQYQVKASGDNMFDGFLDAIYGAYCTAEGGDDPTIDGNDTTRECSKFKPTNVISVSWGGEESTSLFFASGDGGVAGGHGDDCGGSDRAIFKPGALSGCPYITSVGGVELPAGSKIGDTLIVPASRYSPGGRFSNYFPRPAYQNDAISEFLSHHTPAFKGYNRTDGTVPKDSNGGVYNMAGKAYPDIAALAIRGVYGFRRDIHASGGTSMSAPLFADITVGGMNKTNIASCNGNSFDATPGWDPASGLGSTNYPDMAAYFGKL